jgi:hypothetical protein
MIRATELLREEAEVIENLMETMDQMVAADTRKGRSSISVDKQRQLYLACRDQAIQILKEIINKDAIPDETGYLPGLWELYPWCYDLEVELSAIDEKLPHWSLKEIQDVICHSRRPAIERRVLCQQRVSLAEWIFLLLLGMFSFYGMMLVDAGSELMELTLCVITALSVGYLLLFLSDMDDLTRGTFTVDVRVITKTIGLAMSSLDQLVPGLTILHPCLGV